MSKLAGERPAFKRGEKESPGFLATSLKRATGRRSEATATPAPDRPPRRVPGRKPGMVWIDDDVEREERDGA